MDWGGEEGEVEAKKQKDKSPVHQYINTIGIFKVIYSIL